MSTEQRPEPCRPLLVLKFRYGRTIAIFASGRWKLVMALALHATMLGWSACHQAPTIDEPSHLAAGLYRWETGHYDLDRGNPPLIGLWAALPVKFAGYESDWKNAPVTFQVGFDFLCANGRRSLWLITLARWSMIPFSLLGAVVCYLWANDLVGRRAGWLALGLWCICPNVLAHGQLVTGDIAATALGVAACYTYWRWLKVPAWRRALSAGTLMGGAELAKYVWLPLYGLWPALWLACRFPSTAENRRTLFRQVPQLATMLLLSLYVIHLGYLFEEPLPTLRESGLLALCSKRDEHAAEPNGCLADTFADCPVPLPKNYTQGLREVVESASGLTAVFLNGEWHPDGVWYYYLAAVGMKVPLGILLLVAVATLRGLLRPYRLGSARDVAALVFAPLALFALVSANTSYNHLRYVLPVFPFAFIWASQLAALRVRFSRLWTVMVILGWLWAASSMVVFWPHSLSYCNELVGGPRNGHEHLFDSNVDWGQDLLYLKDWLDRHPKVEPLRLAYYGVIDPRLIGLQFRLPPMLLPARDKQPYAELVPGWYAVSVNFLHSRGWYVLDEVGARRDLDGPAFAYFGRVKPVGRIGYSILLYHLRPDDIAHLRSSLSGAP